VEAVELLACHVFNDADRYGQRVSMELVRTRLAASYGRLRCSTAFAAA